MKTCRVFASLLFIVMFLEFIFKKKIQDMNGIYCLKKTFKGSVTFYNSRDFSFLNQRVCPSLLEP